MQKRNYANRIIVLIILVLAFGVRAEPRPITGIWRTIDEKGRQKSLVKIYEKDGLYFGKIIALTEPRDKNGRKKLCRKCPGKQRNKSYIGLLIIRNLKNDGNSYSGGTIMDPELGKRYFCRLKMRGNHLEVYAYTRYRFIGRRQIWIR